MHRTKCLIFDFAIKVEKFAVFSYSVKILLETNIEQNHIFQTIEQKHIL